MSRQKYDPSKVFFEESLDPRKPGGMIIGYKGIGKAPVPDSLMEELTNEALRGKPKTPDYYYTWEFMQRCIEHNERQ